MGRISASALDLVKPARWAFNIGQVDPQWRWVWRGMQFLWPLWEHGGRPRELRSRGFSTLIGAPQWRPTITGIGLFTDGVDDAVDLGGSLTLDDWTVLWVGIPRQVANDNANHNALFACDDFGETDETGGRDALILKQVAAANTGTAECHAAGTGGLANNIGLVQDARTVIAVTRQGTSALIYVNGIQTGSITVGSGTGRNFQFPRLGCHRFSGSNQEFADADVSLYMVVDHPWTAEQVLRYSRDPFGPLRMARRRIAPVAAAGYPSAYYDQVRPGDAVLVG